MSEREAGIQPYRLEFIRETSAGDTPSDPDWILYSDNARTFEPSLSPNINAQEGLGTPDSVGSYGGTEQSELTVSYDLQQWLIDGSSNALDASYDAVERSNGRIPNTHSVVRRMDVAALEAGNTISGSTARDTRLYFVGKGGKVDQGTFTSNIDSGQPIMPELQYKFEYGRLYQVDQPTTSEGSIKLWAKSTDSSDTGITITIEDEGASTTEDLSLDGSDATTEVGTTATFSDIDAIEPDSVPAGDIEIYVDDGTGTASGDQIAVLYGQSNYDNGLGDEGIPALGAGSHASAIGSAYELPLDGDTIEFPTGTALADNITSHELQFSNNVDEKPRNGSGKPVLTEGKREAQVSATVFGQVETYQQTIDMMTTNTQDYQWTPSDPSGSTGSITLGSMAVTEVSESEEAVQDVIEVDVTLENQQSVTVA